MSKEKLQDTIGYLNPSIIYISAAATESVIGLYMLAAGGGTMINDQPLGSIVTGCPFEINIEMCLGGLALVGDAVYRGDRIEKARRYINEHLKPLLDKD